MTVSSFLSLSPLLPFLFQSLSTDPVLDKVWGVLIAGAVGQMIVGLIFMISFVAIVRKSIDKDIPAKLQSIDKHIEQLASELLQMRREVDRHGYRLETLEKAKEKDDLDDSRSRQRPTPRR